MREDVAYSVVECLSPSNEVFYAVRITKPTSMTGYVDIRENAYDKACAMADFYYSMKDKRKEQLR
jgi:hypothetical protein